MREILFCFNSGQFADNSESVFEDITSCVQKVTPTLKEFIPDSFFQCRINTFNARNSSNIFHVALPHFVFLLKKTSSRFSPRRTFREAWCQVFRPDIVLSEIFVSARKVLLLLSFLFLNISLFATPPRHAYRDENGIPEGWVFNIYSVFSYVHYAPQPGMLDIKFPYKLSQRVNFGPITTTNENFSSQNTDLIGKGKWVYPSLGLEIGKENFTLEAQMGWYVHYWSDNIYGGLNYRFILKKLHRSPNRITLGAISIPGKNSMRGASSFPVKISLGFFYYQPLWTLGDINVGSKQFQAMGYTMQSLDSNTTADNGNIRVYYHQNILALKPSFSIGYRPENNRLDISFTASPIIILSEIGGLRFYLNNSGNVDWVPRNGIDLQAVIPLSSATLDATYKGEDINNTPFHLKGWMFTMKLGIRISRD